MGRIIDLHGDHAGEAADRAEQPRVPPLWTVIAYRYAHGRSLPDQQSEGRQARRGSIVKRLPRRPEIP